MMTLTRLSDGKHTCTDPSTGRIKGNFETDIVRFAGADEGYVYYVSVTGGKTYYRDMVNENPR